MHAVVATLSATAYLSSAYIQPPEITHIGYLPQPRGTPQVPPQARATVLAVARPPFNNDVGRRAVHLPQVNVALLARLCTMQLLIGSTIFTGGPGAHVLNAHSHLDEPHTWLIGAAAALPLLQLGRKVERSDSRDVVELNAATNQLALRIFGARQQPLAALLVSIALGALVGVVEETLFRGQVLPAMATHFANDGHTDLGAVLLATLASSAAFGAAHISIFSGLEGLLSRSTAATFAMQSVAGLWLAGVALAPGAGLGAAIVAHGAYDACTLFWTHILVTDQYSHAAEHARDTAGSAPARTWRIRKGSEWVERCAYAFHLLDVDRSGGLTEPELRTGASTHGVKLNDELVRTHFAHHALRNDGDIDFGAFLQLVAASEGEMTPYS